MRAFFGILKVPMPQVPRSTVVLESTSVILLIVSGYSRIAKNPQVTNILQSTTDMRLSF